MSKAFKLFLFTNASTLKVFMAVSFLYLQVKLLTLRYRMEVAATFTVINGQIYKCFLVMNRFIDLQEVQNICVL